MSAVAMMKRIPEASPLVRARTAGALYFLSLGTAILGESIHGKLSLVAGEIAVGGMVVVTLLFYDLFRPVSRSLSLLAASSSFVGLGFEALRWNPQGVDIALVFLGLHHLLIGYLIFRSSFFPRMLGALMAFSGLGWLTYLSNPLVNYLSPYNLASGLLGEGSVFLWLLVMGVNAQR